jgi:RNA polymerase sigma factor (sigma-70 family)
MDATTLGRLIDRYAAALVLYARQWCAAPEDVVQDAFLALMARVPVPDPVAPWLFKVVRNRAVSTARADRRRRRPEQDVGSRREPWFRPDPAGELDAASLRDALAELPAEQREIIVAHLWGGLTFEQVGALADCSTSMAYRRYVAGVETLRARLGGNVCPQTPTT